MNPATAAPLEVVLVGGGMITQDQVLPSLYQLQRLGRIGPITICALSSAPLQALAENPVLREAFPGHTFRPLPSLDEPPERAFPELFREAIAALPPHNLVIVAVPDHLHDRVIRAALESDQHVLAVKPLVQTYAQAAEIERIARQRGLFVGVEYHKRLDRRALDARGQYRRGRLGEFRCGEAKLVEPYYYRHSNFQNWFTKDQSDPFTYVGCHYVDLVWFITGLRPVEVSVRGVEGTFPNGNVGYLWSIGQVVWENGAVLSVLNGLGYPDQGAGTNDQGLCLFCEGPDCGGVLRHDDQFRGVSHGYVDAKSGAMFRFVSPDYFRLVPWEGDGLKPVGYGYDSIEALVEAALRVNAAACGLAGGWHALPGRGPGASTTTPFASLRDVPPSGLASPEALAARQRVLADIDRRGLLATPANSFINELVTEAARLSIAQSGRHVRIDYAGTPRVGWQPVQETGS